ncbi:hypothetical protein Q4489_14360 [Thalassotalea sp. 1_MG-2023]|uniref:hypothetical protein n=1 Tax=Thalassotalea sp. 1_MG-2023 TaxID=3062680 RepID=UPI0026E15239|nr:hypothetical protein [Thalassotalea sp. 1_MG-2023]MDO6428200.1 hypothetical protein [Thalassotalea sp. 1_MG-2023]
MSDNQNKAFWGIFIIFCIFATAGIYLQGTFDNITLGGSVIMTIFYLFVAFLIRLYIKSNSETFD